MDQSGSCNSGKKLAPPHKVGIGFVAAVIITTIASLFYRYADGGSLYVLMAILSFIVAFGCSFGAMEACRKLLGAPLSSLEVAVYTMIAATGTVFLILVPGVISSLPYAVVENSNGQTLPFSHISWTVGLLASCCLYIKRCSGN